MANADGGIIVVGLWNGTIEGTDRQATHRNLLIRTAVELCIPPVRLSHFLLPVIRNDDQNDHLLVLEVEPSRSLHSTTEDLVFLRIGDTNKKLTYSQRTELVYDKGQASYEAEIIDRLDAADAYSNELVDDYARCLGAPNGYGLLKHRGLISNDGLATNGGVLLFGEPLTIFPNAYIRVSRFRGNERATGARQSLIADARHEGPIPVALMEARSTIQELQPRRRALGRSGVFEDVPLVPEDAWLEGLVNAAIHRSYSAGGDHIHIDIFDDRIEIESPGRFPGIVDLSDPRTAPRFARNPRIARVCADLSIGQEFGEGIKRMFEEMQLAGLNEPIYYQTSGSVRLTLSGELQQRAITESLPRETRIIVEALHAAHHLSTGEVAELLGVARPAAIRRLRSLEKLGLVRWSGKSATDPRAFWALPE